MKKYYLFIFCTVFVHLAFAQPANDDCTSAENIIVSTSQTTVNFSIADATLNNEVGCDGTIDDYGDIWYEFTMPSDGNLYINSPYIVNNFALYESCSGMQLQCDFGNPFFTNLLADTNYKLRLFRSAEYLGSTGLSFGIRVMEKPTNDECLSAQPIAVSTNESDVDFNIFGATFNYVENCSGNSQEYLDIWYEFTMPIDGKFVISDAYTLNTFALYDDCSGTQIQCGDSMQFADLTAGTTYKLRMMNSLVTLNGITGNYDFTYFIVNSATNDDCSTSEAISVTTNVLTVDYDIDGADLESSSRCNGTGIGYYADIWYDFIMPVNGNLIIDTAFTNENYYEIYDTCGTTRLDCGYDSFVFYGLSAGTNYKLRVFRAENELFEDFWDQTFDISAAEVSSNNDCANSENITITSTPLEIFTSFGGSTFNSNNECATGTNIVDLWYDFTMPIDGIIQINKLLPSNGNFYALYDTCDGTLIGCFQSQGNFTDLTMGTNYKLRFFDNNQFNWDVDFTIQTSDALGVNDQTLENAIRIYPNPASDYINIAVSDSQTILAINCYDIFGKKVIKTTQNEQVDVSKLQSGLYFVTIETDKGQLTKKIIIQ